MLMVKNMMIPLNRKILYSFYNSISISIGYVFMHPLFVLDFVNVNLTVHSTPSGRLGYLVGNTHKKSHS